jgi:hypothetical protein
MEIKNPKKSLKYRDLDILFMKLLRKRKPKNTLLSRFDLTNFSFNSRKNIILKILFIFLSNKINIVYRILFWEEIEKILSILNIDYKKDEVHIYKPYKNGQKPGILFIEDNKINIKFISNILHNHFNYEKAKEPSLNIRLQILSSSKSYIIIDIYDDRGFDLFFF